jgi:RHS repeat-associated protein
VYTYSNIGRPIQASDTLNSIDYVKNATYTPQGDLAAYVAGNTGGFAGINVSNSFNARLQPGAFSASVGGNTIFSELYSFIDTNSKNNGNLMSVQNGLDSNRNQTYTYDYLNRLLTAQTAANSGQACWGQNFTYDRYGNLSAIGVSKCSAPTFSLTPSTTTNRFTDSGFAYDAAGNMTNDTSTAYTYDAENKMLTAGTSTMVYDGDGLRVKSNNKLRWRMPGGGMYVTTTDASGGTVKDMIYFAGQQVAQRVVSGSVVSYYFSDQVGSVRMMVDATATTCWDADYYPFGGSNIFGTINCQPQYRYTLMETEPTMSSDDEYAIYRYYSHRFARFMSADPIMGDPSNPQTWNRYAYALNSPAEIVDPMGLEPPYTRGNGNANDILLPAGPGNCVLYPGACMGKSEFYGWYSAKLGSWDARTTRS